MIVVQMTGDRVVGTIATVASNSGMIPSKVDPSVPVGNYSRSISGADDN